MLTTLINLELVLVGVEIYVYMCYQDKKRQERLDNDMFKHAVIKHKALRDW